METTTTPWTPSLEDELAVLTDIKWQLDHLAKMRADVAAIRQLIATGDQSNLTHRASHWNVWIERMEADIAAAVSDLDYL